MIAVCAVPEESGRIYGPRGRELYCIQDTAAATENLLLAATEAGLDSCWVGAFDATRVARALELEGSDTITLSAGEDSLTFSGSTNDMDLFDQFDFALADSTVTSISTASDSYGNLGASASGSAERTASGSGRASSGS